MRVGVIGLSHKSADLDLRDSLAKVSLQRFTSGSSTHGEHCFVLLSTCNRTEVYFTSEDLTKSHSYLLSIFRRDLQVSFEHQLYSYFAYDCFKHLAFVTSGMDSAIIGETEIQGQVKLAYENACLYASLPSCLHFMFQKCLHIGKQLRAACDLESGVPSLSRVMHQTAESFFGRQQGKNVLFVGASRINHDILTYFLSKKQTNVTLCNRSKEKFESYKKYECLSFLHWEQRHCILDHDVIIFGTKAAHFLLSKEDVERSRSSRLLLMDLSVPRNVDPRAGLVPGVTLLNIDHIDRIVKNRRRVKGREFERARQILLEFIDRQFVIYSQKEKQRLGLYATAGA